jgi:hypothetical protein
MNQSYRNKISIIVAPTLMIGTVVADPGAVFAVDINGNDENILPGSAIYINGKNLPHETLFTWFIYDMEDPDNCVVIPRRGCVVELTTGNGKTTDDGDIISFSTGWEIPAVPSYKYKLYVVLSSNIEQENDFYAKVDTFEGAIPEFPTIALPIAAVLGLLFVFQSRKKKEE